MKRKKKSIFEDFGVLILFMPSPSCLQDSTDHLCHVNLSVKQSEALHDIVLTFTLYLYSLRPPTPPIEAILLYERNQLKRHVILCFRLP